MSDPISPADSQKAFAEAYQKLCKEHGWLIQAIPQWRQSQDTGTWSMVIVMTLVEYKEPQP